jgi:hypothetical protein
MTATHDDAVAELQRANAELRRERDAALLEKATLAEELTASTAELADRKTEFDERIEHQSATIDVLKAMRRHQGCTTGVRSDCTPALGSATCRRSRSPPTER